MEEGKKFLDNYDVQSIIRKLQDERSLKAGDRFMKGKVGREVNSPERVADYI